jgi:phosphoribosylformimino-5-aminoimidazole carboxamide ribotide isomerase
LKIYPVLDIQGGVVVHGKAGERSSYRPIQSPLCRSADPLVVASAFREQFGFRDFYVADLDAIAGSSPAVALEQLKARGFRVLADAGPRSIGDVERLIDMGVDEIIAPLETLPGPHLLEEMVALCGAGRVVFSLDLKGGRPLTDVPAWCGLDPAALAAMAVKAGARRVLVLDLGRVGSTSGPGQLELVEGLISRYPSVEVLTGGGVRSPGDLLRLKRLGVGGVLVATALHDGSISPGAISAGFDERETLAADTDDS